MSDPLNYEQIQGQFTDISTASTVWMNSRQAGSIKRVVITLVNAITLADSIVTMKVDNVAVSGSLTIAFTGSAKGTSFVWNVNAPIKQGSLIEVITDGASSTTCIAPVSVTVQS